LNILFVRIGEQDLNPVFLASGGPAESKKFDLILAE